KQGLLTVEKKGKKNKPDLVNPSISEPWECEKYVLVDMIYSSLAKQVNHKK
ncbi:hypothetical protein ILR19_17375, partial [Escherichia coli]|nr:hypothetical protein [Escherichia coli]